MKSEGALEFFIIFVVEVGVKRDVRLFLLFVALFNGSKLFINLLFPLALIYFTDN
jgi:hypothetical protein